MHKIFTRGAIVAALVLAGITATTPAQAAECHVGTLLCGKFANATYSDREFYVGTGWNGSAPTGGVTYRIDPGHSSTEFVRDADAIYSPCAMVIGVNRYARGKWYKVGDAVNTRTVVVQC